MAPNLQQLLQPQGKIIISQQQGQPQKVVLNQGSLAKQIIIKQPQVQQKIVINSAGKIVQPAQQQQIIIGGQRILLNPGQQIVTQTIQPEKTIVAQHPQPQNITPQKIIIPAQNQTSTSITPTQTISTSPQQQQQRTQIVVQNSSLAQQISTGKVQIATINGQQVLIKQVGNNQAVVVAHIKPQGDSSPAQVVPVQTQSTIQATTSNTQTNIVIQPQQQQQLQQQQPVQTVQQKTVVTQNTNNDLTPVMEAALLKGQPQGTVIKCVTAQVIQTQQGPRIVLQGLQGSDFTQQQSALVQQQVKQQLLKGK